MDSSAAAPVPALELNEQFAIPGALSFEDTSAGLTLARIHTPAAAAELYLQGAHLTSWTRAGEAPVLYLSPRTELAPGKAIRGGIPVIFPWFGPRHDSGAGPSHGFARTTPWKVAFAALSGEDLHLTLTLAPDAHTRELGFDAFALAFRLRIGRTLSMELTVANTGTKTLAFEEALHTYFHVADATTAAIDGLGGAAYLDKRDNFAHKVLPEGSLVLTGTTDRVFLDTDSTCVIADHAGQRRIAVHKSGSNSTVVWNPWSELAPTLPDMDPKGWRQMLCVETANVDRNAITLEPGTTHTMSLAVSVHPMQEQENA